MRSPTEEFYSTSTTVQSTEIKLSKFSENKITICRKYFLIVKQNN